MSEIVKKLNLLIVLKKISIAIPPIRQYFFLSVILIVSDKSFFKFKIKERPFIVASLDKNYILISIDKSLS